MSGESKTGERIRRTSDVIDSLGETYIDDLTSARNRRTTSPDLRDTLHTFHGSSPLTPRSDKGYCSGSVSSISSPLEPKWFRFSQSGESRSVSRQNSVRSDVGPSVSVRGDSSNSSMRSDVGPSFRSRGHSTNSSMRSDVGPSFRSGDLSSYISRDLRVRTSTTGESDETVVPFKRPDTVDAQPVPLQPPTTPVRREFELKETLAPVERTSYEYNMTHAKRGIAVIFNHENFRTNSLSPRDGSKQDVISLAELCKALGFEVRIYDDLYYQQIYDVLIQLSQEDHSNHDCIWISVLTHGLDGEHLYAYDTPYPYDDLYNFFNASNCLSLAGKPKIFIIQACRGKNLDPGVRLVSRTTTDSAPSTSYTIPTMSDYLIANSTYGGFYSWRNPEKGTWYIQSLVRILLEQHTQFDLLTMMTRVACTVATEYESYDDMRPDLSGMKQAPSLISTLIRQIYFRPKELE